MLTNPSPVYLFGFLLQESLPKNIQLLDYLVDNSAFKLNANSSDLVSANKFISLLLENKLIDKESIKINRIINQSSNNQSSFSGVGAYQFSFKGLIATIKDFNIFYGGREQNLVKYFLVFVLFGLPVFFYTKYFVKIMQNNIFVGEIFETNNFENRIYLASSITLIICYILVQNWFYREIFFIGLIPWIFSNDYKKNSFIDILFYSILIKFILTTIFAILVQNYSFIFLDYNLSLIFLKHLIDFYLMWVISLILVFNLAQYFKKLKSRAF